MRSTTVSSSKTVTITAAAAALSIGYMMGRWASLKKRRQEDLEKCFNVDDYIPLELQNTKFTSELKLAVKLALRAGQRMNPHINHKGTSDEMSLEYSTKSNVADIATCIDEDNESMIISEIRRQFPTHKIIGEEMTGTSDTIEKPSTTEPTWIIDPVDGTTNFANGLPLTCVSIGLCDPTTGGKPAMACVYVPATEELFLSVRHCGSYRNKQRIFANSSAGSVNQPTSSSSLLQKAVIVFEFGSVLQHDKIDLLMKVFSRILKRGIRASRSLGSGVLDLCYVAAGGKVDAVYCGIAGEQWKPWDYCAGSLIIEEANGCITTIWEDDSNKNDLDDPLILPTFDIYAKSMIAGTNVALVKELRSIIRHTVAENEGGEEKE